MGKTALAVVCALALLFPASVFADTLYEHRGAPSGAYASQPARGYVLTIHGGGWVFVGRQFVDATLPWEERLNAQGYATLSPEYRAGHRALGDVVAAYDRWRAELGPKAHICALGSSAGGHLALMLARKRPHLACVVSYAGPTHLRTLSPALTGLARKLFARHGGLDRWSPALHPPRQPLLLAHAISDPLVPYEQSRRLAAVAPNARLVPLRPGAVEWVHAHVSAGGLHYLARVERAFLARRLTHHQTTQLRRPSRSRCRPRTAACCCGPAMRSGRHR